MKNNDIEFPNRKGYDYYEYHTMDTVIQHKFLQPMVSEDVYKNFPYGMELGEFEAGTGFETKREGLPSYHINYTLFGKGLLTYNGTTCDLMPGQLFWIDCSLPQHYRTDPDTGVWHHLWIHINGEQVRKYYDLFLEYNKGNVVVNLPGSSICEQNMRQLLHIYSDTADVLSDITAANLINGIMTEAITCSRKRQELSSIPTVIYQAKSYLDNHYMEDLSLDTVADCFHINKYYFIRRFHSGFGQTPGDYLTSVRLHRAKELLKTTRIPVYAIGELVGFFNTSHFVTVFKKHEKMTPKTYRNLWLGWKSE